MTQVSKKFIYLALTRSFEPHFARNYYLLHLFYLIYFLVFIIYFNVYYINFISFECSSVNVHLVCNIVSKLDLPEFHSLFLFLLQ